ncbi:MAG: ExeA family protein [Thermoguttaceae bacterium]
MYEASFGLSRRPFSSLPTPELYFPAAAAESARQTLIRCVQRGEGVGVVVGPTGCGKSLLGRMLAEHFRPSMHTVCLASGRLDSRRALLQAILFDLGRPFRQMEEGELRLSLTECLSRSEDRRPMLLIADEAETLPLRLLDELRMTTNLSADGEPCSRLVLLGGPALEERLTDPRLESFTQRIVARCYLEAMNRTETRECIQRQLAAASASKVLFSNEACDAVYQATDGVPRLINQLCDHALILAFADGRAKIDRAVVEEAWADLQQLPTPWNGDKDERPSESIIEFGGLQGENTAGDVSEQDQRREACSVPALRVAPDESDLIEESNRRLDGIEESLEQLDNEFEPAGSIVPEIELVFHDPADLLNEDFLEEEIVADRYTQPEADQPAPSGDRPASAAERAEPSVELGVGQATHSFEVGEALETSHHGPAVATAPAVPAAAGQVFASQDKIAPDEAGFDKVSHKSGQPSDATDTLDIRSNRPLPHLKHSDFARLFSNLRRRAQ